MGNTGETQATGQLVAGQADIPPGEGRRVDADPPIAVWNVGGVLYATDDTCTHAQASLSDGYLDEDLVECPFHSALFCVRTGEPVSPPATVPLRTYLVEVDEDGRILIDVSTREAGRGS
jgi:3-phenylpropionate/trans-cinnamate dioxygenase ferredoxin subunit